MIDRIWSCVFIPGTPSIISRHKKIGLFWNSDDDVTIENQRKREKERERERERERIKKIKKKEKRKEKIIEKKRKKERMNEW